MEMVHITETEKVVTKVVKDIKYTLDESFAKELAIALLSGNSTVISYDIADNVYGHTETIELSLPKGIIVTIERETYR